MPARDAKGWSGTPHYGRIRHLVRPVTDGSVIEYVLLVCLGFLSAVLLVLLIAPSLWRRAAYLTEKRIRATVPLTLEEVRAEKDKLRAEFAMTARRYEMKINELVKHSGELLSRIGADEEEIVGLKSDGAQKADRIAKLESDLEAARSEFAAQSEEFDSCIVDLRAAETQIEEKLMRIEQLERGLTEANLAASNFQIDLAAAESDVERLREQLRELRDHARASEDRAKELASDLKFSENERNAIAGRLEEKEKKLETAVAASIELEERLARREAELERLRQEVKERGRRAAQAERAAGAAEKRLAKLEKESARLAKLFDGVPADKTGQGELKKMISRLIAEHDRMAEKLARLKADKTALENDVADLTGKLSAGEGGRPDGSEDELRERIGDIAARVVYMTAMLEGAESPINAALEASDAHEDRASGGSTLPSLADRIRSLQKSPAAAN